MEKECLDLNLNLNFVIYAASCTIKINFINKWVCMYEVRISPETGNNMYVYVYGCMNVWLYERSEYQSYVGIVGG